MLLSVDNLSVSRGGISLFEGLNFTLSTGEFVLINGGNGVGKTSLLRSIAGLQPIDKGKIAINADNFVFTGDANGIKTALTVLENLRFWSAIFGASCIWVLVGCIWALLVVFRLARGSPRLSQDLPGSPRLSQVCFFFRVA